MRSRSLAELASWFPRLGVSSKKPVRGGGGRGGGSWQTQWGTPATSDGLCVPGHGGPLYTRLSYPGKEAAGAQEVYDVGVSCPLGGPEEKRISFRLLIS